jgi:hypothetical protein
MNANTIVVVSHRRSGTHWTMDALRHNHPSVSDAYVNLDRLLPWHESPITMADFKSQLTAHQGAVLIKTHVPPTLEPFAVDTSLLRYVQSLFAQSDVVYVYRDGRDVLVSLYYYMRHYDPGMREVSFSDFIRMKSQFDTIPDSEHRMNRVEYWKSHVEGWLKQSAISRVSYEDLHANYEVVVKTLATGLGRETAVDIKPVDLRSRYPPGKLHRLALGMARTIRGRSSGTSSAILPRKGVIGEWRRHFSHQDVSFFNSIAGDLLQELGYL